MALETVPLFVPGGPGPLELGILLLIAVLLFGANKIPELARSTGEAMGEFQKGREEVEQELEEMRQGPSSSTDTATETEPATETETASETDTTSTSE